MMDSTETYNPNRNFNSFILPILAKHPSLMLDNNNHIRINPEEIQNTPNIEAAFNLEILDKQLFSRYRVQGIEGMENKGYIFEEINPKTGQVLSRMMFLNDNVLEQDIPMLSGKAQELGVSTISANSRQVAVMYERGQQQLLLENNYNPDVIHDGQGFRTRFGFITSGLSLLMVYDLLSQKEYQKLNKIKALIKRIRRKKTISEEDAEEAEDYHIPKQNLDLLLKPNDEFGTETYKKFHEMLDKLKQYIPIPLDDIKNAVKNNPELYENALNEWAVLKNSLFEFTKINESIQLNEFWENERNAYKQLLNHNYQNKHQIVAPSPILD